MGVAQVRWELLDVVVLAWFVWLTWSDSFFIHKTGGGGHALLPLLPAAAVAHQAVGLLSGEKRERKSAGERRCVMGRGGLVVELCVVVMVVPAPPIVYTCSRREWGWKNARNFPAASTVG